MEQVLMVAAPPQKHDFCNRLREALKKSIKGHREGWIDENEAGHEMSFAGDRNIGQSKMRRKLLQKHTNGIYRHG